MVFLYDVYREAVLYNVGLLDIIKTKVFSVILLYHFLYIALLSQSHKMTAIDSDIVTTFKTKRKKKKKKEGVVLAASGFFYQEIKDPSLPKTLLSGIPLMLHWLELCQKATSCFGGG